VTVNLYVLYKQVKRRVDRATSKDERTAAVLAAAAAKRIVESPTLFNVRRFHKAEKGWLLYKSPRAVSVADQFSHAIASGHFETSKRFNSAKTGWRPKEGRLYCAYSSDLPGQVKIGCVSSIYEAAVYRRLAVIRQKLGLKSIQLISSFVATDVALVESRAHRILEDVKVRKGVTAKSNEWFKLSRKKAVGVLQQALNTRR